MSKGQQPKSVKQEQVPITRDDVLRLIDILESIDATLDEIAGTNAQIEAYLGEMRPNQKFTPSLP